MNKIYTLLMLLSCCGMARAGEPVSFQRNVVVEEVTGTWCQWCIYGMVYMEQAAEQYGDRLIPISVHGGGVNRDPMEDLDYCTAVEQLGGFFSYPNAIINRDRAHKGAPRAEYFDQVGAILEEPCDAAVELTATINEDLTQAEATARIMLREGAVANGWHLAYVMVEDSVHQPGDSRYNQANGYAGGFSGEMAGYEDKPKVIPAEEMYYRHVARSLLSPFNGIDNSLPADMEAGIWTTHTFSFSMPENILVPANCRVVALLLDADNHVVNAAIARWSDKPAIPSAITSPVFQRSVSRCSAATYTTTGMVTAKLLPGLNVVRLPDGRVFKTIKK